MRTHKQRVAELESRVLELEQVLLKIAQAEYSHMNSTVYECATILSNMAQDALGVPYLAGDFSIADRYAWETRGDYTLKDLGNKAKIKRLVYGPERAKE